jgi:hypothetical protein
MHDHPVLGLRQASERRPAAWNNRRCRRCLRATKESKNRQKDDTKASVLGIYSQMVLPNMIAFVVLVMDWNFYMYVFHVIA